MKKIEIIVKTREEFIEMIKSDLIPFLIRSNLQHLIDEWEELGLFTEWTFYSYCDNQNKINKSVKIF